MKSEKSFGRLVMVAVVLGFLSLIVAVAAVAWAVARQQEFNAWVSHTFEVEAELTEYRFFTERVEATRRGFLLQQDERFVDGFRQAREQLPVLLDRIEALTSDNPDQRPRVLALRQSTERQIEAVARAFEERTAASDAEARARVFTDGSFEAVRESRRLSLEMVEEEERLLAGREASQQRNLTVAYVILGSAGLLLLVVAGGTIWAVRRNLMDLNASRDSLRDLNENLESAVDARTADLRRANEEIQRFAYIVSHDLRSPLVNVMGFTSELDAATKPLSDLIDKAEAAAPDIVTEDARLAVREELPEAIGFIRSSTQKMDRLINAILRLSREGRRVITPERLRIGEMLDGIAGSLQHRITEIGAEITIAKSLPEVVSDRVAVEQIFSNLVENSIKYAEPDRPVRIAIRGSNSSGRVVYEVEDNGRGIDAKDHDRIFDLFRRSGAQDQPGEGIGLAHVRALAYRLGGNVSCKSEIGKGATFSLTLPSVYRPRKEG